MFRRLIICVASVSTLALVTPVHAGNEPEKAQHRAEEELLPKLNAACGALLSLTYDGESLRKNNKDISGDQTDGENQCNEPLSVDVIVDEYVLEAQGDEDGSSCTKETKKTSKRFELTYQLGAKGVRRLTPIPSRINELVEEFDLVN